MAYSQSYRWNPEEYAGNSQAQKNWGRGFLKDLTFRNTDAILDIGSGDGIFTRDFAERVRDGMVVGMDISPDMVRYASSHFPVSEYKNLSFIHADALLLPFKDVFDVIFSNSSFHWISDHRTLLAGLYRVLCPGGRLLIQMGGKGNAGVMIEATERVMARPEWSQYFIGFSLPFTFFSPEEYYPLLREAGFSVKRLELVRRDMLQKGREDLTGSIRNVWQPFLDRVPDLLREDFLSEVIDILVAENTPDDQGYYQIPMFRLEVEAFR